MSGCLACSPTPSRTPISLPLGPLSPPLPCCHRPFSTSSSGTGSEGPRAARPGPWSQQTCSQAGRWQGCLQPHDPGPRRLPVGSCPTRHPDGDGQLGVTPHMPPAPALTGRDPSSGTGQGGGVLAGRSLSPCVLGAVASVWSPSLPWSSRPLLSGVFTHRSCTPRFYPHVFRVLEEKVLQPHRRRRGPCPLTRRDPRTGARWESPGGFRWGHGRPDSSLLLLVSQGWGRGTRTPRKAGISCHLQDLGVIQRVLDF